MGAQSIFSAGLVCGTFFHFFVNDQEGPIGIFLRQLVAPLRNDELDGLDDHDVGLIIVGLVMQSIGILQSPLCYGPKFDPFAYFFMVGEAQAVDKIPSLTAVVHEDDHHPKRVKSKDEDVAVVHESSHHHKRVTSKDEENQKEKVS
jgi:hypothetical protein